MSTPILTKQYIRDADGNPIGIILPIEEYRRLTRASSQAGSLPQDSPLLGALSYLGGEVAPTETLDETIREMWSSWDRETDA
jgi:hypothetical protein